jgi:hypothetical protein
VRRLLGCLLAGLAVAGATIPAATARAADLSELRPLNLRVGGGAASWHADNDFRLDWDRPPVADGALAIKAVHLRLRDSAGNVVAPAARFPWDTSQIEHVHVPSAPGRYTAEVWLETSGGKTGPPVSATLLFDDARPGPARPLSRAAWVAGVAAAVVTLEHPPGPLPIAGIRGYAVSVDRGTGSAPCGGPDRCSPAETDVRDGIEGDTVSLGLLAEGVHVVRAVAVSGSGMRSAQAMDAIVRVDASEPEVAARVPDGWVSGPVRVRASAVDPLSGMAAAGPSGPYTAIAVDGGVPRTESGDSAVATVSGEGSHSVAFYARDAAGNSGAESPRVAAVRIDESPPVVAFARAQDPAEPERIEATVGDALSGVDPARGSIAVRPSGSRQRFRPLETTVTGGRLVARWDSDAFEPGTYEFRATGHDLAGNAASSERRANGTRMVLANPLKRPTAIAAGFGGRRLVWQRCSRRDDQRRCRREAIESFEQRPTTRVVPYGRGVSFGGRLASSAGTPLGGLPIEVVETFEAGADSRRRISTVHTDADGTFATRLPPGPSRSIEAVFAGSHTLTRAGGGGVRLKTLGGVRVRASSASARIGGAPVIFSGRVRALGTSIPATGRPVELQFRLPGGEWSEFRTVQTDRRGRFRYAYPFSDDDSQGVRFQFRAFVPAQEGWPYEPAASRPVFVTGQ